MKLLSHILLFIGSVHGMSKIVGVGTTELSSDKAMTTFCQSPFDFYWNWAATPDANYTDSECARERFAPMLWGDSHGNAKKASEIGDTWNIIQGYNEPDHYGPPLIPGGDATSSGLFPGTFHCGSIELATNWQGLVKAFLEKKPNGSIWSPSMADSTTTGSVGPYGNCDTAPQTKDFHVDDCKGWLLCFKESVQKLNCGRANCWDVIDIIQFHAYYHTSDKFINKLQYWEESWADDLQGLNGRTPKKFVVTEFAHCGTSDPADPDGEGRKFMTETIGYMANSDNYAGWSWFAAPNTTFASFVIDRIVPTKPFWDSTLIYENGETTELGKHYASLIPKK